MNEKLKNELTLLRNELGTPAFDERLKMMAGIYTSVKERTLIMEYIHLMLDDIGVELNEVKNKLELIDKDQDGCFSLRQKSPVAFGRKESGEINNFCFCILGKN